jgi:hypothetical protein
MTTKFDDSNQKIHAIVREKIERRRKELKEAEGSQAKKYLLDVMLEAQEVSIEL